MEPIQLAISGVYGRMGQALIQALETSTEDFSLVAALSHCGGKQVNSQQVILNHRPITIENSLEALLRKQKVEVLIDFTQPCLLYTSPSPRDRTRSRMPSSA